MDEMVDIQDVRRFSDESLLDFSSLLHASGRDEASMLIEEDWGMLADETMATVGRRSPAKSIKHTHQYDGGPGSDAARSPSVERRVVRVEAGKHAIPHD